MATNWMRWNDTTHVFEKSSDGVSFIPVPINASCISEGTLPPAVIPGGGNAPDLAGNNTFTGINTIANAQPVLQFLETDQGVNLKGWQMLVSSGVFYIGRTMTDAGAGIANLFAIDRAGNLSVTATGAPSHNFAGNADGYNILHMVNSSAGASAASGLMFQSNVGDGRGYIIYSSSGNSNGAWVPDALALYSVGAGGIVINCAGNAPLTFRTSNAVRLTIDGSGLATFAANATVAGNLIVNGASTLYGSVAMNALSCSTINSNGQTVTFGAVNCGAVVCTGINQQGNGITTGGIANSGVTQTSSFEITGIANLSLTSINGTITVPANTSLVRVTPTAGGQSLQTINGFTTGRVIFLWNNSGVGFTIAGGGNISMATGTIAPGGGILLIYDVAWRPLCSGGS